MPHDPVDSSSSDADSISRREFNRRFGAAAISGSIVGGIGASGQMKAAKLEPAATLPATAADLCFLPATELVALLRSKKISAREVMQAHLSQIERVNPKVNAIVTLVAERAIADAAKADEAIAHGRPLGPLHGLPVAHKDLVDTAGIRTTRGSPFYRDFVPTKDAAIVQRIRAAGAVTLGKTNTPEFGAGSHTFNTVFGATHNPYDLSKTCGGSSGGAAVSLACGMLPIADGSDTGGSLRNPAAFCNVVGLRPSPGRVPAEAHSWSPLSVSGPMARNVADVALFLSAIAGPDRHTPLSIDEDPSRFAKPLGRNFKGARVAWWKGLGGIPFEPEIRQVIDASRKVFESLGCIVEEAEPDFSGVDVAFPTLRHLSYHSSYAGLAKQRPEWVKETIRWEIAEAERQTAADVGKASARQSLMFDQSATFFERFEYFILPVTQVAPFDITVEYPREIAGTAMGTYIDWMRSCWYVTFMANPAMSVPAGFTSTGLPVGIQIVGRPRGEWSLLQLGYAFEQATHYGRRRPAVVA
jgi:amidase